MSTGENFKDIEIHLERIEKFIEHIDAQLAKKYNLSVHLTGVPLRFTPAGDFCVETVE